MIINLVDSAGGAGGKVTQGRQQWQQWQQNNVVCKSCNIILRQFTVEQHKYQIHKAIAKIKSREANTKKAYRVITSAPMLVLIVLRSAPMLIDIACRKEGIALVLLGDPHFSFTMQKCEQRDGE